MAESHGEVERLLRDLRIEYEARVRDLRSLVERMQHEGAPDEAIARTVHAERRALAANYKNRTPEPWRTRVHARTLAVYRDPLGPTIEHLRTCGKSWADIIASAIRPGERLREEHSVSPDSPSARAHPPIKTSA